MTARAAVVGANGRVGRAICEGLRSGFEVVPIVRDDDEAAESIAERATRDTAVVINAAGVAHVEHPTAADLARLQAGNVELPVALAARCLERRVPLVHVSSVKAADPGESPYAASKREADERLEREFGAAFAASGLCLMTVRPLALLLPPYEAGKLARLRWLWRWPVGLTPPVRLPVLDERRFVDAIVGLARSAVDGTVGPGFAIKEFDRADRATLRHVRDAMGSAHRGAVAPRRPA